MHYIYLYTRISDGMQYVGQTLKRREKRRKWEHLHDNTNYYFGRAYRKNPDDFVYCIIDEASNQDDADQKEIYWIAELDTKFPNGFNLTIGGAGCRGLIGLSGERNPMYGRTGELSPRYGKRHTKESKRKMSEAKKGKPMSEEHKQKQRDVSPKKKKCICVELNIIFDSVRDATRWLKDNGWPKAASTSISAACNGKYEKAYGYHWKHYTEEV